jgi:hypothetical protein
LKREVLYPSFLFPRKGDELDGVEYVTELVESSGKDRGENCNNRPAFFSHALTLLAITQAKPV